MKLSDKIKDIRVLKDKYLIRQSQNLEIIRKLREENKGFERAIGNYANIVLKIDDFIEKHGDLDMSDPILCRYCGKVWDNTYENAWGKAIYNLTYPCQDCFNRLEREEPFWRTRKW